MTPYAALCRRGALERQIVNAKKSKEPAEALQLPIPRPVK